MQQLEVEHGVCDQDTRERPEHLRGHVCRHCFSRELFQYGERRGHDRIEVRAGSRAKRNDQRQQREAGRERVGEQRDCGIGLGQTLSHDAGADYGSQKKRGADKFPDGLPSDAHDFPISSRRLFNA